jgi:DNA-binding NarL/FixJ family response regulator
MKQHECPVVISDMHLTDGNGLELFSKLRKQMPGVRGIIVSGSGVTSLDLDIAENGISAFLQKPIDTEVLYKEIAAMFSGGPADHTL